MSNKFTFFFCLLQLLLTFTSYSQSKNSIGLTTGFNRGYGINANFTINNIAEGLPGNIRFGIGYNIFQPGNAADARRIFINNNTNGVPEKKANHLTIELTI